MRYVLIDFRHICYKTLNHDILTTVIPINGVPTTVDTTVASFAIKDIFYKSNRGAYFTGVFLEGGREGFPTFRKQYFEQLVSNGSQLVSKEGYKGQRKGEAKRFYTAVNTAEDLLKNGNVSVYRVAGLEADDVIAAMVHKIKYVLGDTTTPIDIITNDNDHLPLVDDQVSVYVRGSRTYADGDSLEHKGYYRVTPHNWHQYLEGTSAFGDFYIPYNSMLLFKLIRGDDADGYKGAVKGYGKVSYSALMRRMEQEGVDFANTFRYNVDFNTVMRPVLERYFEAAVVDQMAILYQGINMIQSHNGVDFLPEKLSKVQQLDLGTLQMACDALSIRISR